MIASPATIASFSGQDASLTAQGDVHAAAAHTASLVSGETTSLYTHQGELQTIAANGNLSLLAHTDQLEILADQDIAIVSANNEITITAKQRIEMVGGDSKVVLDDININFITTGSFISKAATNTWGPAASGSAEVAALPQGLIGEPAREIELHRHYDDLRPIPHATYKVRFEGGAVLQGVLDANGYQLLTGVPPGAYTVEFGEDGRDWKPPPLGPNEADFFKANVQADGREASERALAGTPAPNGSRP